jgi:hypothetical protein
MIKTFLSLLVLVFAWYWPCPGQNILAAKAAELQIIGEKTDGTAAQAQSNELTITYKPDGIYVNGTLPVSSITSGDIEVMDLISEITAIEITFETTIPPDQFIFGSETDAKFISPATLYAGSVSIEFNIDFTVSHQRVGDTNTFLITGTGELSMEALGIGGISGLSKDRIAFIFRQNVRSTKVG